MITIRPYNPATFLTVLGALAKVRLLKKRGFPCHLRNWRFLTLTFDRDKYPDPEEAYDLGKRHLREYVYQLRKHYGIHRWCRKTEFHQPDEQGRIYAHFHLLLDYKRPIPVDELTRLWGKGIVYVECVMDDGFDYLFKYVAKALDYLPHWFLARTTERLFQTSRGFFPATPSKQEAKEKPLSEGNLPVFEDDLQTRALLKKETIGEKLERWSHSVVIRFQSARSLVPSYRLECLSRGTWADLLVYAAERKFAHHVSEAEATINPYKIETICQLILPPSLTVSREACS